MRYTCKAFYSSSGTGHIVLWLTRTPRRNLRSMRRLIYSGCRRATKGRAEVISVTLPLCFVSLIWNAQTSEYLRRSGQDHLCPLETCCVPVEWNNEETNFLFCQSYVNHVISKSCQNTLQEQRKEEGGGFILRKYWSFTAFIAFDCHLL